MSTIETIFEGLRDACNTSFFFKNGDFTEIKPEYLLTVLVAKQFSDQNNLDKFIIRLEEATEDFATSCVPETNVDWEIPKRHNCNRNGRIDIAIYSPDTSKRIFHSYAPLFPIELKGIDPTKSLVLEDLKRNMEYFLLEDEKTGKSILEVSYFACIEEAKKFIYEENKNEFIQKVERKYKNWTSNLKNLLNHHNLDLNIYTKEVMSQLYSKDIKCDSSEGNTIADFVDDWHYYVGVIVEIKKQNVTTV
ncbi:MAG: hypothetical protein E2604_06955 [Flavobacterium sp.]|nr:hypothetical protein [Flavobacterium sp.]